MTFLLLLQLRFHLLLECRRLCLANIVLYCGWLSPTAEEIFIEIGCSTDNINSFSSSISDFFTLSIHILFICLFVVSSKIQTLFYDMLPVSVIVVSYMFIRYLIECREFIFDKTRFIFSFLYFSYYDYDGLCFLLMTRTDFKLLLVAFAMLS